jgi:hypothetical protein
MEPDLWNRIYGTGSMEPDVWNRIYGTGSMVPDLWNRIYGTGLARLLGESAVTNVS